VIQLDPQIPGWSVSRVSDADLEMWRYSAWGKRMSHSGLVRTREDAERMALALYERITSGAMPS
jgi:hypothetical protein